MCHSVEELATEHTAAEAAAAQLAARTRAARATHRPLERYSETLMEGQLGRPRDTEAPLLPEKRQRCDDLPGGGGGSAVGTAVARALELLASGLGALREAAQPATGGGSALLGEELRAQLLNHARQVAALAAPAAPGGGVVA